MAVLIVATTGFAQTNPGQNNGRGNRGFGQQGRQQFDQRLKEELGATDDEWGVLQPRIEKVRQLERDASTRGSRFGRRSRNNNADPAANPSNQNPSPVQEKAQALRQLLADKSSSAEAIKTAVAELRDAKAKAHADLKKAQDELRDLLTPRQEAVLIMAGMLE